MRLQKLDHGHTLGKKAIMLLMRLTMGTKAPDVVKFLFYRGELFGSRFSGWLHAIMRGPSKWSVGERELFAAVTSRLNQCVF
jgi:hypothetical protein